MPATYEKIATTTLGSASATITFSSIAASWTDLRLVLVATVDGTNSQYVRILFNNNSSALYSTTELRGDGSAAASSRTTDYPYLQTNQKDIASSIPGLWELDIFSYAGSTNKTTLLKYSGDKNGSGQVLNAVGLFRSTSAINEIKLYLNSTYQFQSGTTATLYGILKA